MQYNKPAIGFAQQIQQLEARGLVIPDRTKAEFYLANIGYYRLSAYMLPFQQTGNPNHIFHSSTTFDDVLELYVFDREFRLIIFDIIERVEIAFRTQVIYNFSMSYDPWWFEDYSLFIDYTQYIANLNVLDKEVDRSKEVFIKHYKRKYTSPQRPPAWMSLEVSSMGTLSKIFKNLRRTPVKKLISGHFGLRTHVDILESWAESATYVRNICAHHSRLWNRTLTVKPTIPRSGIMTNAWLSNTNISNDKVYAFTSCMIYLLKTVSPTTHVAQRISDLLMKYPRVNEQKMGFPVNWRVESLWT